ncbi:MAG: Rrf2 family transcriptional regulator [Bacillota bacterium]|nr:Rrf2 family transcriptional regulator [Bacillota bacterium]
MEFIRRNTDYALRALSYMATHPAGTVFSVSEVSRAEQIPEGFLRKIFQKLAVADIVTSHRGPRGGFSLAHDPGEITALEIVEAIQGRVAVNRCLLGRDACERWEVCRLRQSWVGIQEGFVAFLKEVTLKSLVEQQAKPGRDNREAADPGGRDRRVARRDRGPRRRAKQVTEEDGTPADNGR